MPAYKRSIFLINKPFQFRFSFFVCSWLFALSLVYPVVIYTLFGYLIRYISLDPFGPPLEGILKTRQEVIWLIIVFQIVFAAVTFLISIFVSHRIAGPLFKLRRYMGDLKKGVIKDELYFRKTDHFQELAKDFNDMAGGLRGIFAQNADRASGASRRIENAMKHSNDDGRRELQGALDALKEIQQALSAK